jgi:hypothetical protein
MYTHERSNMAVRFSYDATPRILFTTAEGMVSLAEIERHLYQESESKGTWISRAH